MKQIVKILSILAAVAAFWIGLLETLIVPRCYTWLLPIYLIVTLGCYGLFMVGLGLMNFPTCPHEAVLLQKVINFNHCFVFAPPIEIKPLQRHSPTVDTVPRY